jgi:chromate transporter
LGLIGFFLRGVLILIGTLPFWETFRNRAGAQAVMRGVNAAVVGLLGAALCNPVWTSSVKTPGISESLSSALSFSPCGVRRRWS